MESKNVLGIVLASIALTTCLFLLDDEVERIGDLFRAPDLLVAYLLYLPPIMGLIFLLDLAFRNGGRWAFLAALVAEGVSMGAFLWFFAPRAPSVVEQLRYFLVLTAVAIMALIGALVLARLSSACLGRLRAKTA